MLKLFIFWVLLGCNDLPNDSSGQAPNPFIVLSTIVPPQQTWIQHSNTEVVEVSTCLMSIQHSYTKVVEINSCLISIIVFVCISKSKFYSLSP